MIPSKRKSGENGKFSSDPVLKSKRKKRSSRLDETDFFEKHLCVNIDDTILEEIENQKDLGPIKTEIVEAGCCIDSTASLSVQEVLFLLLWFQIQSFKQSIQ